MSFTKVKPAGWTTGERLTSTQMNDLDTDHANAVDGVGAGTYPFTTNIGLKFTGTSNTVSPLTLQGTGVAPALSILAGAEFDNAAPTVLHDTVTFKDSADAAFQAAVNPRYLPTRSIDRIQEIINGQQDGTWTFHLPWYLWRQNNNIAGLIVMPLTNLIDGATMTAVTMQIAGKADAAAAGHAGVPGTLPILHLYKRSGTTVTNVANQVDTSGTAGAYDAAHTIAITGLTEVIGEDKQYWVGLSNESGANSVVDTTGILRLVCTFTVDRITPGG